MVSGLLGLASEDATEQPSLLSRQGKRDLPQHCDNMEIATGPGFQVYLFVLW